MASQILVSGAEGNIGKHLTLNSSIDLKYVNTKIDFLKKNGPAEYVDFANNSGCNKILHLAWSSNTSNDYLNENIQEKWVQKTIEMVERASSYGLSVFCVGSGQELEHNVDNAYVNAKRKLHSLLNSEITAGEVTWIRPFYIFSKDLQIPRIVRSFLADSINFRLNKPLELHDYIEIRDVASAIQCLIRNNLKGTVEIGYGKLTSNSNLLKCLFDFSDPNEHLSNHEIGVVANIQKIVNLGWRPIHTRESLTK